jgi:RNA helicase
VGWGPALRDGTTAYIGDRIVTTENKRRLLSGPRGWVKNGDEWIVTALNPDGSITAHRARAHTTQLGQGAVVLPADYVAEKVELAYASTAHRAQGATVDTAHAYISPTTSREVCYVAATRAKASNKLYVDTHYDPTPDTSHGPSEELTATQVLAGVLDNTGADVTATVQQYLLTTERRKLPHLRAEYTTIARTAAAAHWATQVRTTLENNPDLAAGVLGAAADQGDDRGDDRDYDRDDDPDAATQDQSAAETAAAAIVQSPHFPSLCDTLQTA